MKRALIFRGLVFTPIHRGGKGGFVFIRVISWFMSFLWSVVRGGLPLSPSLPLFVCFFLLSCSPSTDAPPSDEGTVRERVVVSGSITEDAVWESGKEYVVR